MRIAQITDLHLRHHLPGSAVNNKRRSRRIPELLPQALDLLRHQRIDLLAVTGDLLDVPGWVLHPLPGFEYDDPAPWRDAALRDYHLLRNILDNAAIPYTVLPGNHDDESTFWQVFDRSAHTLDLAGHRVIRFCDREWDQHIPRRFTTERVRWEQAIADAASPPQIHLQHYVVTPPLNDRWPHTYAEGDDLMRRTDAAARVRLSLSGHYHDGTGLIRGNHTVFATGPCFAVAPFPFRIYDLAPDTITVEDHHLGPDATTQRPCVFLDRDGVINDLASYRTGPEVMNLIPGSAEAIAALTAAGYAVVVITDQSAIGRGYVPEGIVNAVNDKMYRLLARHGAAVDALYYLTSGGPCSVIPRYADNSKTKTDLIRQAAAELNLNLTGAWMIGDRPVDVASARAIPGLRPLVVRTGDGNKTLAALNDPTVPAADNLLAAISQILQ